MKKILAKRIAALNQHDKAWVFYQLSGKIPMDFELGTWALHHVDPELKYKDPTRYAEWRIEDVIPVTFF